MLRGNAMTVLVVSFLLALSAGGSASPQLHDQMEQNLK